MSSDAHQFLRRLERTAAAVCLAMSAAALVIARGRPGPAVAVLAGGLLIGVSYWTIGLGVHALAATFIPRADGAAESTSASASGATGEAAKPAAGVTMTLARVLLRYALLALLAYVMIARLRLHPIGLLAGASSIVAAAALEAGRFVFTKRAAS
jgi:hypothetical protein